MNGYTQESLAIEAGQTLKGEDVEQVLNRSNLERGVPKVLFYEHSAEITGQAMDLWAYSNSVKIDFSRPGKPTDNTFMESFNGTFTGRRCSKHLQLGRGGCSAHRKSLGKVI